MYISIYNIYINNFNTICTHHNILQNNKTLKDNKMLTFMIFKALLYSHNKTQNIFYLIFLHTGFSITESTLNWTESI